MHKIIVAIATNQSVIIIMTHNVDFLFMWVCYSCWVSTKLYIPSCIRRVLSCN